MIAEAAPAGAGLVIVLLGVRGRPRPGRPHRRRRRRESPPHPFLLTAVVLLLVGSAWLAVGPGLTLVGAVGWFGARRLARSSARRRQHAAVAAAVPDLVDLFLIAASAGHPVATSLLVVSTRAPVPLRPAVRGAAERFQRGLSLAECLASLGRDLGPTGGALTDALAQAASSGVPLVPLLEGVARTARDQRRRRAQEAARRLPVTMLFPLVACILPAAVLLAVVPVLVASVSSLAG